MLETFNSILSLQVLQASVGLWLTFLGVVTGILILDLGFLNRKDHEVGVKESLWFSLVYIILACMFGVWVWVTRGIEDGSNFFTAYVVEQSLSLDNLFVMSLIFTYFGIPRIYQHRVLFWGVVGVVVMRGIMIGFGTTLIHHFDWVLLVFAAFLIFTGIKMVLSAEEEESIDDSKMLKFLKKHMDVTPFLRGNKFFIRRGSNAFLPKSWQATPLFLALVTIELADVLFAVDSVPAVLSITSDTFVVYTSNIFAVLGLRTMYFAVAALIHRFAYMKYALSIILIFIGLKSFYNHFVGHLPSSVSLAITLTLLAGGFVYSMIRSKADEKAAALEKPTTNKDLLGPS
ncbi:MAG: integral rane TerC family protein [Micavibrio sp.]|nr:integral rane TerC family protein [Micavibrio sp.]